MIKATNNITKEQIINLAILQLGKKYKHGSHGEDTFDCAGLVWYLYYKILNIDIYQLGFGLSTTTKIMTSKYGKLTLYNEFDEFKDLSMIKKSDILFFHRQSKLDNVPKIDNKYPGHCGIYISDNKFIHCTKKSNQVIISDLKQNNYWYKVLVGSKKIL